MLKIKIFRKRENLSQKELAQKTGIDRSNISEYENGKGNPTQETLSKIAAALNCKIGDLID